MSIKETADLLSQQQVIVYPTDTVWGIGGDATNPNVVQRIYDLKKRADSKALICLVHSVAMLRKYVKNVPKEALTYINADRPTTLIYQHAGGLANNLIAEDGSIAIRIPKNQFCLDLINTFGKPIISTSANLSGTPTPQNFNAIDPKILDAVDYIVPLQQQKLMNQSSRILKINTSGKIQTIRP